MRNVCIRRKKKQKIELCVLCVHILSLLYYHDLNAISLSIWNGCNFMYIVFCADENPLTNFVFFSLSPCAIYSTIMDISYNYIYVCIVYVKRSKSSEIWEAIALNNHFDSVRLAKYYHAHTFWRVFNWINNI